jgi:glutamate synthase (ferredoxin)
MTAIGILYFPCCARGRITVTVQRSSSPPLYRPDLERDACGIGLVADARGRRSHDLVEHALSALVRMTHRGAPPQTASIDGSGILTQIPWRVYRDDLPPAFSTDRHTRALGMFFMPRHRIVELKPLVEDALHQAGFKACHWRTVPVRFTAFASDAASAPGSLEAERRKTMPAILQVAALGERTAAGAETALYGARVRIERLGARARFAGLSVVSLSTRTVVYKGLLTPSELTTFYPDLADAEFSSAIAVVHQRFSTNTAPQWGLAQPFQVLAHNGEIATVAGNRRWAGAAAKTAGLPTLLGAAAERGRSDSSSLDAAVQALCAAGCSLPHALSRLVPPAWEQDDTLSRDVAAFFEYQSCFGPSWDGPAALAFTDGDVAGALLDRNGFRPARYVHTRDRRLYLGSEAGIFDVPERDILQRGRLAPGGMILVDTRTGEILETPQARARLAAQWPYRAFVARTIVADRALDTPGAHGWDGDRETLRRAQTVFGYTQEDVDLIVRPMACDGTDPLGSMGDDASIPPLSKFSRVLPDYFRQRFAQVTNPAIDPLRERCVMSLRVLLGPLANWANEEPPAQPVLSLPSPVLDAAACERIAHAVFLKPIAVPLSFDAAGGPDAMARAIDAIATDGAAAAERGTGVILLTDRALSASRAPIPPLLAVAALHERLLADGLRTRTSIVVETGEARDAHQIAVLCAHGAAAVFPYVGLDTAASLGEKTDDRGAPARYRQSLETGLLKIMSKMGVTTFAAYCGSGLFDVIGLDRTFVERFFPGAGSPLGGRTLAEIAGTTLERHRDAFATAPAAVLRNPGFHSFRRGGEQHAYDPAIVRQLHRTAQPDGGDAYRAFVALVDARQPVSIRDLLAWKPRTPIPVDAVEPVDAILRRFFSAAMSIGALSPEAHQTLAIGMNRIGGRSNSGEGGEPAERFAAARGREWAGSAIKQVASARFGVTPAYLRSADELQIKIAQGSKPGEGGQLPAVKVVRHIAALRHAQPGISLISPPVHHDIYSIEDLAQLIYDLRRFHPSARIGVKLVSAAGVGIVAAGTAKAGADAILISGHDGGTGASPRGSIKHAGLPWEIGLAEAHQVLTHHGLRDRVVLQVDGGLQRGRDVAVAAALGADEYGFGTAALVAIGCVMARQCHLDTCPAGIATQRTDLRQRFAGTPDMVEAFFRLVAQDVRVSLAAAGLRSLAELVGRADLLEARDEAARGAGGLDVRPLLVPVPKAPRPRSRAPIASREIDDIDLPDALGEGRSLIVKSAVRNVNRAVGTALAGRVTERFGAAGLPPASVVFHLEGTAGQSLGAFLVPGIEIHVRGEANDYVGKGMHGGTIAIRPLSDRGSRPGVAAGNAVLYGATGGRVYIGGSAGERFAVRNSGAIAVVEGIGDHGCEYMTGGVVIVLGAIGRNFASGMTGGAAYVLAAEREDRAHAAGAPLDAGDWMRLEPLLSEHWKLTGSARAASVLGHGAAAARMFVKWAPEAAAAPAAVTHARAGALRHAAMR